MSDGSREVDLLNERYTGFRQLDVADELINSLYANDVIDVWDKRLAFHPNLYLELKSLTNEKHTILAKLDSSGEHIKRLFPTKASGVEPRNREQVFALDALMDDSIPVVVLSGVAGSGKTLLALAAAFHKVNQGKYEKVILTRPMSEVGKYKLGALPGDVDEKFSPYLINYMSNLECLVGAKHTQDLMSQSKFEIMPLQLIRGASFHNALVLADEMQVCNHMEILTLGTRIGDGSKLVLMGDLSQRDSNIGRKETGMYYITHNSSFIGSPYSAQLELQQCIRSGVSKLFIDIFNEEDDNKRDETM